MPVLELRIILNENEWKHIEQTIASKKNKVYPRGKGLNQFLTNEINKRFVDINLSDCNDLKVNRVKKNFSINISEDTLIKINCLSERLKIKRGTLIAKLILDPHLSGKNPTT